MSINTPYITSPEQLTLLNYRNTGRMKPTFMSDFFTKYCFQKDLYSLRGLLAALLHIDCEEITDITILNPIEPRDDITEEECLLDLELELHHSLIIDVEIQIRHIDFWPERSLTYLCRSFDHLKNDWNYFRVKPCIQIVILEKDLFKENDSRYISDFYSEYRLLNTSKHTEYSSKFEIRVLSLNRLENASEEEKNNPNGLYHWAKIFRASLWEEVKMVAKDKPMISSFVGTAMELIEDEEVAQAAEMRRCHSIDLASYEYELVLAKERAETLAEKDAEIARLKSLLAQKQSAKNPR